MEGGGLGGEAFPGAGGQDLSAGTGAVEREGPKKAARAGLREVELSEVGRGAWPRPEEGWEGAPGPAGHPEPAAEGRD